MDVNPIRQMADKFLPQRDCKYLEDKKIKKLTKSDLMILMFERRVELAYSLKKMDIIPDLPEIKQGVFNKERLIEYFNYYDIQTLKTGLDLFNVTQK